MKYIKNPDKKLIEEFKKRVYYFQADFYDKNKYEKLNSFLKETEQKHKLSGNRLFYLATLPQHFEEISFNLKKCGLAKEVKGEVWTRVAFEKPFGSGLKDAKRINKCIKNVFKESQIYRLDHYLGKELVQNISILRFANALFEPLWNNKHIEQVQLILSENMDVGTRGLYYDKYGAVKDVVQNHLMQLLSLVAMDQPKFLTGKYIRNEKVKLLKKVKKCSPKDLVIGQYKGYKKERFVKPGSKTETFAALKLEVNNKRWKNVPFYLITGKGMKDKITSIYVQFKQPKCLMFNNFCGFDPNYLVIQIQPDEGFYVRLNAKSPGGDIILPVKMDFCHECTFGPNTPEAYETLMLDVINKDQSVFVRSDEIEQQWRIIDDLLKDKHILHKYKKGSYPKAADKIINGKWHLVVK